MIHSSYVCISHILDNHTPCYNGENSISIKNSSEIGKGDSTNSLSVSLKNHTGTHLDFPNHFFKCGKTLDDYDISYFFFTNPALIHIPVDSGVYIDDKALHCVDFDHSCDILIISTGYGKYYNQAKYWNDNPGINSSAAIFLKSQCPNLRCVGVDFMSINAYTEKDPGRIAHRKFLEHPEILLLEDLDLRSIKSDTNIRSIMAIPLRIAHADGAPCTVIAEVF